MYKKGQTWCTENGYCMTILGYHKGYYEIEDNYGERALIKTKDMKQNFENMEIFKKD